MAGRGLAWLHGFIVEVANIAGDGDGGQVRQVTSEQSFSGVTDSNAVKKAAVDAFLSGFHDDVVNAFDSKKDPETGLEWLPRVFPAGHPLMVKTGRLQSAAIAATLMPTETPGGVRMDFTDPIYGFFHHYGVPDRNLPQRRFFGVSPQTVALVGERVVSAMESVLFPN